MTATDEGSMLLCAGAVLLTACVKALQRPSWPRQRLTQLTAVVSPCPAFPCWWLQGPCRCCPSCSWQRLSFTQHCGCAGTLLYLCLLLCASLTDAALASLATAER